MIYVIYIGNKIFLDVCLQASCGLKMDEKIRKLRAHAVRKYERLACHPSFGVTFGYQTLARTTRGRRRRRRRSRWCLNWHTFHHTRGAPTSTGFSHVVTWAGSSPLAFKIRFLSLIRFLESCDKDSSLYLIRKYRWSFLLCRRFFLRKKILFLKFSQNEFLNRSYYNDLKYFQRMW